MNEIQKTITDIRMVKNGKQSRMEVKYRIINPVIHSGSPEDVMGGIPLYIETDWQPVPTVTIELME